MTTTDLVEVIPSGIVRPAASVNELVEAQTEYRNLCDRLLVADDYQRIGDRQFRKKSGWRKLNVAFNVSTELVSEDYIHDDDGKLRRAKFVVRATAPNGRHADGIGICDRSERKFSKPEHDIAATAYTRAANRASSDLYGLGEVSAEEMDGERPKRRSRTLPGETGEAVTDDQLTKLHAMFTALGITNRDERLKYASAVANRDLASSKTLTKREASRVIDLLEHEGRTA